MTVSDVMTPLMDKVRKLTGLTDKISIARLTGLMDSFLVKSLVTNSSSEWVEVKNEWDARMASIPVSKGEKYTFTVEVADNTFEIELSAVLYDSKGNILDPYKPTDSDGNAPINIGNQSNAYLIDKGYSLTPGKAELTVTIKPSNCTHLQFRISSIKKGDFSYRNPIIFQENSVGGGS